MTQPERRRAEGVALLTQRRQALIPRLRAAGIAFYHIVLQEGPQLLPKMRPPLLLDTFGLELPTLIALLIELQRETDVASAGSDRNTGRSALLQQRIPRGELATIVLVDPGDMPVLRLVSLCTAVRVITSDTLDLSQLTPHTRHLNGSWSPTNTARRRPKQAWVGLSPPPDLHPELDPLLLPALHALQSAVDNDAAADACEVSRATLMRVLSDTRKALGMSAGASRRYSPPDLAAAILAALSRA